MFKYFFFKFENLSKYHIPGLKLIEREVFPGMNMNTFFESELLDPKYLYVVCLVSELSQSDDIWKKNNQRNIFVFLYRWSCRFINFWREKLFSNVQVIGYIGLQFVSDEAHIVSIAVGKAWRRLNIGEMLLTKGIICSETRKCNTISLEVRVSNTIAQNLYKKYGFENIRVRPRYYSDDQEDALVMSVKDIDNHSYINKVKSNYNILIEGKKFCDYVSV